MMYRQQPKEIPMYSFQRWGTLGSRESPQNAMELLCAPQSKSPLFSSLLPYSHYRYCRTGYRLYDTEGLGLVSASPLAGKREAVVCVCVWGGGVHKKHKRRETGPNRNNTMIQLFVTIHQNHITEKLNQVGSFNPP